MYIYDRNGIRRNMVMKYYLAPMEGLTTYIFRAAHHRYYGGMDKYFAPFISNRNLSSRETNDILPEHNAGMELVPQILTNRADVFLDIAEKLAFYGYQTVNLNLGCPSGTVTARKRGAGFLSVPQELERFLDEIFEKCRLRISIKTRIGILDPGEWEQLLEIYKKFPLEEVIIHPRLLGEYYSGVPHGEAFSKAREVLHVPLCYNGNITSRETFSDFTREFPFANAVMIGRGILMRPDLLREIKGTECTDSPADLQAFHDEILEGYRQVMSGDTPTLHKMKDLWTYLSKSFEDSDRHLKKIQKASRITDYEIAVKKLFKECRRL